MVCFGGPDRRTLYVTSARTGRSQEELAALSHSGGVFAMPVETPGLPEPVFDPLA
jgi:sugar lactone lactonase YvrE